MKRWITLGTLAVLAAGCPQPEDTVYFLVADAVYSNGDSYLLPLTDPDDIDVARTIASDLKTFGDAIVVADIEPGSSDGAYLNEDLEGGLGPWSWHVAEFVEFAGATAAILDGTPTLVEQDVDGWIANTGGRIGFWNYTVVREVDNDELTPAQ